MKRRLLASLLTLVMMLNLLPTVAWARNDEGIDADSVEMYSSDDVVTSGPITLWTGKEGQITVPEGDTVRSSNADIVSVEQDGTAVTLTGGSKEGRAEELRKIKESRKEQEADKGTFALDKSGAFDRAKSANGKTEHKQPQRKKKHKKSKEAR